MMTGLASPLDLRLGMRFGGDTGKAIHSALREAADTIVNMPARYLVDPYGGPVLPAVRRRSTSPDISLSLDGAGLWSFGAMRVPRDL